VQFDVHRIVGFVEQTHGLARVEMVHAVAHAKPESDRIAAAGAPRHNGRAIRMREDVARLVEKDSASVGQFHPTLRATQQRGLQFRFELLNLMAEGGLRDPKLRRSLPEVQGFGERDEITQMA
jgi:hypothetical protein